MRSPSGNCPPWGREISQYFFSGNKSQAGTGSSSRLMTAGALRLRISCPCSSRKAIPGICVSWRLPRRASAICTMVPSASDKAMTSTPLAKKRARKLRALTPPATTSLLGSTSFTSRMTSSTMVVCGQKIDVTPITSYSAIFFAICSGARPTRYRPLGNGVDRKKVSCRLSVSSPTEQSRILTS